MCGWLAITLHRNGSSSPTGTSRVLRNRFSRYEFTFNVERTKERQGAGMLVSSVLWRRCFICARGSIVRIAINWEGNSQLLLKGLKNTTLNFSGITENLSWACCKESVVVTARVSMMGDAPSLLARTTLDQLAENHVAWSRGIPLVVAPWDGTHSSITLDGAHSRLPRSPPQHSRGGKVLHSLASTTSSNSVLASLLASSDHTVTFSSSYSVAATRVYFPSYCLQLISSNTSYVSRLSHIQLN